MYANCILKKMINDFIYSCLKMDKFYKYYVGRLVSDCFCKLIYKINLIKHVVVTDSYLLSGISG